MPKVDIIIPAYNAARYLTAALCSVEAQTFEDWRILLIDDGSTDNTAEVAAPFADRLGQRFTYIKQENQGVSAARNAAIRNSSAEYMALLDSDDIWLPCRLAESLSYLESHPRVGVIHSSVAFVDETGVILQTFNAPQKHGEGMIAPYIYMRKVHLPCPTVTFRRRCIETVGLFDESMRATEDRDLLLRIALHFEVGFIPKVLAHYRLSAASASADPNHMLRGQLRFIEKHYGAPGCGALVRRIALSQCYREHAEALERHGHHWKALKFTARSIGFYPLDLTNIRSAASILLHASDRER
jgi:glycosyltransferase involved in cell wall biosynthesis